MITERTVARSVEIKEFKHNQRTPSPIVLGKRSTLSRSRSPSPETPKSSPISQSIIKAPTKKEKAFRIKTAIKQNEEPITLTTTSAAVTAPIETKLAKIQPLAIKKKHVAAVSIPSLPSSGPGDLKRSQLLKSTSVTSVESIEASRRKASASGAPAVSSSTSTQSSLPPGRGGARRVPLNSSSAAPFTKPSNAEVSAPVRKGPQRPPVPISLASSNRSAPTYGPGTGPKVGPARPQIPSASAPSGSGISRLPKPQIKSRIPGPSAGFRRNI